MMAIVNIGMIGLGEVAQTVHLPILAEMPDRFRVTAICDISPMLLREIGDRLHLPDTARHQRFEDVVARDDVDLVMILTSSEFHAEAAIAAIEAGKHTFIEKPMCLTLAEADAIVRARDIAKVQVLVGYMRRFAPAFVEAVRLLPSLGDLRYGRVRAIIGPNATFIDQSKVRVVRPRDFPEGSVEDRRERDRAGVLEAIGEVSLALQNTYRLLGGLSSHDLSAMRELLGMPLGVVSASHWNDGRAIHAVFDYGSYQVAFETHVDAQARFDANIEVYGSSKSMRIQYDTPYLRQLPTELHITETVGTQLTQTVVRPTLSDPYTVELEHVHGVVSGTETVKTTPEDSREDLVLFQWIIEAIRR
ncbi:MAG: Gfo/Idh/MocA family oxidoreductase, partial [Thermomicrobiales bacterium]